MIVGQHAGMIEAGVGFELGILEDARRSHRQWIIDLAQKDGDLFGQCLGKDCLSEPFDDEVVRQIVLGEILQTVEVDEFVKGIGGDDQRLGDEDLDLVEQCQQCGIPVQYRRKKGQAPGLAAKRSVACLGEIGVRVESLPVEIDDHPALPLDPLLLDHLDQVPAMAFHPIEGGIAQGPDLRGQLHLGQGIEPPGKVVVLAVKEEGFGGDGRQFFLQGIEIRCLVVGRTVGHPEDEVAEAEVLDQKGLDLLLQHGGILVDKEGRDLPGEFGVSGFGTGEQQGDVKAVLLDVAQQLQAGAAVQDVVVGEAHVGDDSEDIGFELLVDGQGPFIGVGQQDLRPGPHRQQPMLLVETVFDEGLGLGDQFLVEDRQEQREVIGRVLDKEDDPHPGGDGIGDGVELVLDTLDDGQQDIGLSGPEEHPVE